MFCFVCKSLYFLILFPHFEALNLYWRSGTQNALHYTHMVSVSLCVTDAVTDDSWLLIEPLLFQTSRDRWVFVCSSLPAETKSTSQHQVSSQGQSKSHGLEKLICICAVHNQGDAWVIYYVLNPLKATVSMRIWQNRSVSKMVQS